MPCGHRRRLFPGVAAGLVNTGQPVIVAAGSGAALAAVALARARPLRPGVAHLLLAAVTAVSAVLAVASGGGPHGAAFACLTVLVTAYAAIFFPARALAAHLVWLVIAVSAGLSLTEPGNRGIGYLVMVLAIGTICKRHLPRRGRRGRPERQRGHRRRNATNPGRLLDCETPTMTRLSVMGQGRKR